VASWLERIKGTMAIDLDRYARAGLNGAALVDKLLKIPEVAQALHLRERGRLDIDLDTAEGQALAAERIQWVADFLDDGFNEATVKRLREVAGDLTELDQAGAAATRR
jgi:hypothetical protein